MTTCVIDGKQCECQPDDGIVCPQGPPAEVQAALNAEITRLRAALAQAGAGRGPVAWQLPGSDNIIPSALKAWRGVLAEQWTIPLYAHPSPAQREPLSDDPWRKLYRRAINEANGLTNYVEDRPELRGAERRISAIEAEARTLADSGAKGAAS